MPAANAIAFNSFSYLLQLQMGYARSFPAPLFSEDLLLLSWPEGLLMLRDTGFFLISGYKGDNILQEGLTLYTLVNNSHKDVFYFSSVCLDHKGVLVYRAD